jgi:hypothetical protein
MISNVCLKLKISESLFEGTFIPLTIKEALIFINKNYDNLNIPNHIKKLLMVTCFDKEDYTDQYIIKKVEYLWLISEIENKITSNKKSKSSFDKIYDSIILCLENYNIYKNLGSFKNTMQVKINEIIYMKDIVKKNHLYLYDKSLELQKLHISDMLVNPKLIRDEFKIPIG